MSLLMVVTQVKDEINNILKPICEAEDVGVVFGPKSRTGPIKKRKFFRVMFEDQEFDDNVAQGSIEFELPIRLTINITSNDPEKASDKSIMIISQVIDDIIENKRFRGVFGIQKVKLDQLITGYPLDKQTNQMGSGIRLLLKIKLKSCR